MKLKNVGTIDRVIRVILAVLIIYAFNQEMIEGTIGIALIFLSVVLILTSIFSYCPIYALFKMSTRKQDY